MNVASSGSLTQTPFSTLLLALMRDKFSGVLEVNSGKVKRQLAFSQGKPVAVQSNALSESAGRVLESSGRLTADQHTTLRNQMKEQNKSFEALLVGQNLLKSQELPRLNQAVNQVRLLGLYNATEGDYALRPANVPGGELLPIPGVISTMLRKRASTESPTRALVSRRRECPRLLANAPFDAGDFGFDDEAHQFLKSLDGSRSVAELLTGAGLPADEAAILLQIFTVGGLIEDAKANTESAAIIAPPVAAVLPTPGSAPLATPVTVSIPTPAAVPVGGSTASQGVRNTGSFAPVQPGGYGHEAASFGSPQTPPPVMMAAPEAPGPGPALAPPLTSPPVRSTGEYGARPVPTSSAPPSPAGYQDQAPGQGVRSSRPTRFNLDDIEIEGSKSGSSEGSGRYVFARTAETRPSDVRTTGSSTPVSAGAGDVRTSGVRSSGAFPAAGFDASPSRPGTPAGAGRGGFSIDDMIADEIGELDVPIPVVPRKVDSDPLLDFSMSGFSPDQKDLANKFKDDFVRMHSQNFFELLGIERQAKQADVRKAYFTLAKEYHTDRLVTLPEPVQRLGREIFDLIQKAYDTLTDQEQRDKYVAATFYGKQDDEEAAVQEVTTVLQADQHYKTGIGLLNAGNLKGAHAAFTRARELYPKEPEYNACYGYTLFKLSYPNLTERCEEGEKLIHDAIRQNPKLDRANVFLGRIYLSKDNQEMAARYFVRALKINGSNLEAGRELQAMKNRRDQQDSSLLGSFFGRFKK